MVVLNVGCMGVSGFLNLFWGLEECVERVGVKEWVGVCGGVGRSGF